MSLRTSLKLLIDRIESLDDSQDADDLLSFVQRQLFEEEHAAGHYIPSSVQEAMQQLVLAYSLVRTAAISAGGSPRMALAADLTAQAIRCFAAALQIDLEPLNTAYYAPDLTPPM